MHGSAAAVCWWPTAQQEDAFNRLFGCFSTDVKKAEQAEPWDAVMIQQV